MSVETAHRQFYNFEKENYNFVVTKEEKQNESLFKYVNDNIIGSQAVFESPFGPRKVTYCDYTASGRSLNFIEDYIQDQVLPYYGSTHTTTTLTSLQTSLYRHESRDIIRNAVRASEHDRIIFAGSGATGALNKLIHGLMFTEPPIVFVDFTAHHSSLLPWREIGAMVIRIRETSNGSMDLTHLEQMLKKHQSSTQQRIGCFTAASNITGIILDVDAITFLLHKYGALSFWDFATAAPYTDVVMNPHLLDDPSSFAHKDALFFSLHKFVGGVQAPGVLIAKKNLFKNRTPLECGGGTVFFVSQESHRYLKDVEEREEGGTPAIVESIRGGMVMQLKMNLGPAQIKQKCHQLAGRIGNLASAVPELFPLGNVKLAGPARLPILSFLIAHPPSGKFLHYNFVSAILNDVFGIQSRGGCACAGPYAQDLLGIDEALARRFEAMLLENPALDRAHLRRKEEHGSLEVLRPGFVRVNLPYTASEEQIDFILSAIQAVARNGWKLLPQYIFNPETAEWKHHTNLVFRNRQWLQNISYVNGFFEGRLKLAPSTAPSYKQVLEESELIFAQAEKVALRMMVTDPSVLFEGDAKELCWFLCPSQAKNYLRIEGTHGLNPLPKRPFVPLSYPLSSEILSQRPEYIWMTRSSHTSATTETSYLIGAPLTNWDPLEKVEQQVEVWEKQDLPKEDEYQCQDGVCIPHKEGNQLHSPKITSKIRWAPPPKGIFNPAIKAIETFRMIRPNDRVLVCLSGGKDSLSLLHTLHQYQYYAKSKGILFTLGAITVDPQSSSYDPTPLIPYLKTLSVPYFYEVQGILKQAMEQDGLNSICSFCSRMKRGRIYATARREQFNVLALGQHLDDLAESFLMSVFHNGRLRTMKASYLVREGDLRVIRPFVFVREKDLRTFAESRNFPIIPENCPACFESPKERHRMKQLLAQQEIVFPALFWSLKSALHPLLAIHKTGLENSLFGNFGYRSEDEED